MENLTIRMPATTANMGPGFDCMGMAFNWYNELRVSAAQHLCVQVHGTGMGHITLGEKNLSLRAFRALYDLAGSEAPAVCLAQHNSLPVSGGLGSSAASVVGGLLAANALLGDCFSTQDLLRVACQIEGHSDNAAACLLGGLVLSARDGDRVHTLRARPAATLQFVAAIPQFSLSTYKSRAALPAQYSRGAVCANLPRVAMMYQGLQSGDEDLLRFACRDALHQPYRMPLIAGWADVMRIARDLGACAAFLSGAGPCIMTVCGPNAAYAQELSRALAQVGQGWRTQTLQADLQGACRVQA